MKKTRIPGVIPMELWDLEVRGGILGDFLHHHGFPELLGDALCRLCDGRARTRSGADLAVCADFERVLLAGGAIPPGLTMLRDDIVMTAVAGDERYLGVDGGLTVMYAQGYLNPLAIDLGQAALKLGYEGTRRAIPRDLARLPYDERDGARARRALRTFVGSNVRDLLAGLPPPDAVAIGLPVALDGDDTPGACSYVGLVGDRDFPRDLLTLVGLDQAQLTVLNDAEMAGAGLVFREWPAPKTLFLTFGFGIGAAVLLS